MTPDFWRGRRVLLTGHTGFKGAWLSLWLARMGAKVTGLSLAPESKPSLWDLLALDAVDSHIGTITDAALVQNVMDQAQPEVVLHLAAQSLVRRSYRDPMDTFATNVLGTVSVLQAAAKTESVQSVVVVSSDKCYENLERDAPYREDDRMGGRDPYSASKGCTELAAASMRQSFFAPYAANGHAARVGSGRAGNVIGGGDWSEDRLIPDIIRGCLGAEGKVTLRSPGSIRPWQHVLEPLWGYLLLAEHLANGTPGADTGWNFGPDLADERPVGEVAEAVVTALGQGQIVIDPAGANLHEAKILRLDSAKARSLGWSPRLNFEQTARLTAEWYGGWAQGQSARTLCDAQLDHYEDLIGAITA